jgi:hypothetical protein
MAGPTSTDGQSGHAHLSLTFVRPTGKLYAAVLFAALIMWLASSILPLGLLWVGNMLATKAPE